MAAGNKGLNARQAEVLNSAFVLLFGFSTKLNICASNPALRQAPNRYMLCCATRQKFRVINYITYNLSTYKIH
jgi:hypothetical protein